MSKFLMLLFSIGMTCSYAYAQTQCVFSGSVLDENKEPLIGAVVYIPSLDKGAVADTDGYFRIADLPKGSHDVEVSFVGYLTIKETINLMHDLNRTYKMKVNALSLQEVVVKDDYVATRKKESALNVEIVNDDYLKRNMGGSLMASLERLPGVSTIDIGSGQSKPVIRGLSFNRVVVVENNVKHEAQQWGADHGLEIDQYAVDQVEVIKGPASLMYGSDAIGGVIDMKDRKVPVNNTFGGSVDLSGKTNNDFVGGSLLLYGRKKSFFFNLRATALDYGDYKVPTDSVDIYSYRAPLYKHHLRNTAGNEQNLHLSFGIIRDRFQNRIYLSDVNAKSGFFANAHGLEPRAVDTDLHDASSRDILDPNQNVNHFKAINSGYYLWDKAKLEYDLGYQHNFRQEWSQYVQHGYMPGTFPDTLTFDSDLELQFDKQVYSLNLKLASQNLGAMQYVVGLNSEYQDNKIDGRAFIIPAFRQFSMGGFAFAKRNLSERSLIQAGLRYDYGHIKTDAYDDWYPSPALINGDTVLQYLQRAEAIDREFSNFTWSLGYNYNAGAWSGKINLGKSFRMPIEKELAANGVNYHHFSYEVGDPDLSPEVSYQLDAGLEYTKGKIVIGVTPFFNYFTNYIYLNPTSEHDLLYGNGNQIFYYQECEVLRYGGEFHTHYQVLNDLQLGAMFEYVYSEQMTGAKKGFSLPFSPPASAILNVKYQKNKVAWMYNPYVSLDYRLTAAQNNIVPPEEVTEGYQLLNLSLGTNFNVGRQQMSVTMQVTNLLNTKYFNHTSYYRLINVPEAGRNFIVNVSIPFAIKGSN